jgi:Mn2+/Fe2+ NRAMP family transporter
MLFFQQSVVVDKGMQEKDMLWGKIDTAVGSFLTVVVAAGCVVLTATLLPGQDINDAAAAIRFMGINRYVGALLAIGLFDADFLGAICISLASSSAFGEVFSWAHGLNHKVKEALWFYAYYFFDLLPAGTVVLIPRAPLALFTLFVQVIAVTLYPAHRGSCSSPLPKCIYKFFLLLLFRFRHDSPS